MKLSASLLCLLPLLASSAFASDYPQKTLKPNSVICYDFSDWREMLAAYTDDDDASAERLVSSGACRFVTKATRVSYLDPAAGDIGALIQLPSGKTAYTADGFLKN